MAAVADELRGLLLGGRVQHIVQPSELSIGLEVYAGQRYPLLLNAATSSAGILLTEAKLRRGVEAPSPLHLLLLKYVRGARLTAMAQPPLERVLRLTFVGEYGPVDLVCEVMGRYSNIILLDADGVVMDSIKRVPASINRYRTILPKQPYVPPPAQDKEDPRLLTVSTLRAALGRQAAAPLAQQLVNAVSAISPILAREIVHRAFGAEPPMAPLSEADAASLLRALEGLVGLARTHAWSPCLAYGGEGEDRHPIAYAPYELTHLADHAPMPRINEAILRFLEARESYDAYRGVRARLHEVVAQQKERQQARLASLRRSLVPEEEIEATKQRANAILALAWRIVPGQGELVVDPAEIGAPPLAAGQKMIIPLDARLTAVQNAQALFQSYHKMKAAAEGLPQRIAESEQELAYLAQLDTEIDLAEDRPQLDEVEMAMHEAGYLAPARGQRSASRSQPLRRLAPDGTLILVGRSSSQNEQVTFRLSGPGDTWLHAHGAPGAHVIIKSGGQPIAEETLLLAAGLAARYSAARQANHVQVDYTARRHVRHIKGGRPGMVTYDHEQTVVVEPRGEESEDEG